MECSTTQLPIDDRSVAQAIHDDEMRLWYQPIVAIPDGDLINVEALLRWAHPTLGLLAPGRFLPAARRSGQLAEIDRWVLAQAGRDLLELDRHLGRRSPAQVAVNVTPTSMMTNIVAIVSDVLADGLCPGRLILEIPEAATLNGLTSAVVQLKWLRDRGIGLVLDDMGAGSTSLRHLSVLDITGFKIDATFIAGMLEDCRHHAVVKLLAGLGRELDMCVTAEGVETPEQLDALAALDIDYAQGFHTGPPEPLDTLLKRVSSASPPVPSTVSLHVPGRYGPTFELKEGLST